MAEEEQIEATEEPEEAEAEAEEEVATEDTE